MKVISPLIHGYVDVIVTVALIILPFCVGFSYRTGALLLYVIVGTGGLAATPAARFEPSRSMRVGHVAMDPEPASKYACGPSAVCSGETARRPALHLTQSSVVNQFRRPSRTRRNVGASLRVVPTRPVGGTRGTRAERRPTEPERHVAAGIERWEGRAGSSR